MKMQSPVFSNFVMFVRFVVEYSRLKTLCSFLAALPAADAE
jgi:hypothetical protein